MNTKEFLKANREHWNEVVPIHKNSELYSLEEFKKGKNKLHDLELQELGDVSGKKILHLQCHFGMDTLSLEMLGANVTGVDFSEEAIAAAIQLRDEMGLKSRFIHSDIFELHNKLNEEFDIVYTSYGVLIWLYDIKQWAQTVSHYLRKGGFLYIAEVHPASMIFEADRINKSLQIRYPYFHRDEPLRFEDLGTYADRDADIKSSVTYEWSHSLSDILMSLVNAGLSMEFFHEHPFTVWEQFPGLMKKSGAYYVMDIDIPLLFSMKALKK